MSSIKKLIPAKYTGPAVKFVRTAEFYILMAANGALVVIPIVTSGLSAGQAVKWGAILDGGAIAARTILKFGMIFKGAGLDPVRDPSVPTELAPDTQRVVDLVKSLENTVVDMQAQLSNLGHPAPHAMDQPFNATEEPLKDDEAADEIQHEIDSVNPLMAKPQDHSQADGKEAKPQPGV